MDFLNHKNIFGKQRFIWKKNDALCTKEYVVVFLIGDWTRDMKLQIWSTLVVLFNF